MRAAGFRAAGLRAVFLAAALGLAADVRVDARPADFVAVVRLAAVDFRAVDLRAAGLRAVVFRALDLRAVDLRAVDLRAPPVDEAARAGVASSDHLPDMTRCAASATASAINAPSLVALEATLLAAC